MRHSLEEVAQTFNVSFSERWKPDQEPVPIHEFDACELYCNGTKVLSGYVDEFTQSYQGKSSNALSVAGRSKTADLVDCAAKYQTGRIKSKRLDDIAKVLCEPFGIDVELSEPGLDLGSTIKWYRISPGETGIETLGKLARKRGVLLTTNAKGNLLLTRASKDLISTELVFGDNIKSCSYRASGRERFSEYHFCGQTTADDDWNGLSASEIANNINDTEVPRYRPMIVLAEHQGTREDLGRRAIWERNTRAGRSERITYTVQGWEAVHGLWEPNQLVRVRDERLRIDDQFLVVSVERPRRRDTGTETVLELTGREAFDVLDATPKRKRKRAN